MQACINIDFKIFNIPCVSKLATTGSSPSSQFSLQAYSANLTQWNIFPSKCFQTVDKTTTELERLKYIYKHIFTFARLYESYVFSILKRCFVFQRQATKALGSTFSARSIHVL